MTGGGVIEAKRASRKVDSVSNFDDFYNGALKVFEARWASRIGVGVLDIPQLILGYRPEAWTVGLRISAHQTMCANVRLFAKTMTAARPLALNGKFVGGLRHEKGHKSKTVKDCIIYYIYCLRI